MERPARELVAAVDAEAHMKVRSLLRQGWTPNEQHVGLLPLQIAVERMDVACVALLLHWGASPDQPSGLGNARRTARECAKRIAEGRHSDRDTRAGRRAIQGQTESAVRILRLLDAPHGDECSALITAFQQRLDYEEAHVQNQRETLAKLAKLGAGLVFALLVVLHCTGILHRLAGKDAKEL